MRTSKTIGLLSLLVVYILATALGLISFLFFQDKVPLLVNILIADAISTVFVWFMGVLLKTASTYDPYWSIQTFIIYLSLLIYFNNFNFHTIIPLVVIGIYSIRLTWNFAVGFHDLTYIDWRYKMLAEKSGKLFQVVNLFGICMFPTLVVFSASIPLYIYATGEVIYSTWDLVGSGFILLGTLLEFVSDIQMKKFIKTRTDRGQVINIGLWKYSRHPNYLGEITIWFGVALILIMSRFNYWYWIFGAVLNLLMFLFISIPMEEKHMKEYKPQIKEYIKTTSCLFILPKRKA